jgi:hypothetical protein
LEASAEPERSILTQSAAASTLAEYVPRKRSPHPISLFPSHFLLTPSAFDALLWRATRNIASGLGCAKINGMTTLTCSIPERLDARLERLAQQANVPKDKFVRKALEQAARKPGAGGAAFNLVKHLCGSLSGPSDLATNPKYLEGLGG